MKSIPAVLLGACLAAAVLAAPRTANHRPSRNHFRLPRAGAVNQFPEGFFLGAATASYQIEGGWNADGKGENIWDHMLHEHPEYGTNGENGDVACDSYHQYAEDVKAVQNLNANTYRFSISWSRILPTGDVDVINQAGLDYYNNLINLLLENGVEPLVTMYHWDLPQALQYIGGWPNPILADYFVEYARVLFDNFGDRVKWWITFNEPAVFVSGYASQGGQAPSQNAPGIGDYLSAHTVLKAHARVYHLYQEQYRETQQGYVGITLNSDWNEPASNSTEDFEAAERARQFQLGLYSHPIFTEEGDYPPVVRQRVDANSAAEGRPRSRLPSFTAEEVEYIKGTSDFFGINHYTTVLTRPGEAGTIPSKDYDSGVQNYGDDSIPHGASSWLRVVPWGFRKLLNWIASTYPEYPIFVTENGYSDWGELADQNRTDYFTSYLSEMLKAINIDGNNIIGYTAWSLLDNLEWNDGYAHVLSQSHRTVKIKQLFLSTVNTMFLLQTISLVLVCLVFEAEANLRLSRADSVNKFPDGFMLGSATASYQVEGGWNADGKGESIWDHTLHEHPEFVTNGDNGDVACDSYHNYEEDVKAVKNLNATVYRFSISWPRILPTGDLDVVNQPGLQYYNNIINLLLENDIQPLVTMYHWDLPQTLQNIGGWPNPIIVDYFVEYARLLFENFGDRVKWWITFNEPAAFVKGYATYGQKAPSQNASGIGDYLSAHTILKAHARVYHLYQEQYKDTQKGYVGITLNSDWNEPASDDTEDVEAAERSLQFQLGLYAHPIFTAEGDYPAVVRQRIDANSAAEGRPRSRLPSFTAQEVEYIKGTSDFFGLNHYTTTISSPGETGKVPSREHDACVINSAVPFAPHGASTWLRVVPWGFRKLLNWIAKTYPGYPIFVTENGYSDFGDLADENRINYFKKYLSELLKAINIDGNNVIGYTAWSLLDNLEWNDGFRIKFGLYHVDFNSTARTRTAKESVKIIAQIFANKELPMEYWEVPQVQRI